MEKVFKRRPPLQSYVPNALEGVKTLFGVISGSVSRRNFLRSWFSAIPQGARLIFVVSSLTRNAEKKDLLRVNVSEFRGIIRHSASGTPSGTLTVLFKLIALLHHFERSAEDWLIRMDDDVVVNLQRSVRFASELRHHPLVYAGVFEWYNMLPTLRATGHAYGVEGSRGAGKFRFNCSASYISSRCVGPFAFAKGPWVLLSKAAVRKVLDSEIYHVTHGTADRTQKVQHRIHDDALLGMWLSLVPNLTYVRVPRKTVWYDRSPPVFRAGHVLVGHKAKQVCSEDALRHVEAKHPVRSYRCIEEPPCRLCLHRSTQRSCTLDLRANITDLVRC